ncbi:MAG: hypothetical protein FWD57_13250, partial [Polyangiaceae bacterium]|nr:hypothetical protein [Polyangiaceae bacterium]
MRRKRHQQPPEGKPEPKRKKQRTPTRKPASLGPITEDSIGNLSRDDLRISRLGRGESRKVSERRGLIAKRLNVGTPHSSIIDEVTRTFNISPKLAQEEVHVVCRERAELSEAERTTFKSEQIIRLQQDLAEMRAEADKPYRCIAAHETLLAKSLAPSKRRASISTSSSNKPMHSWRWSPNSTATPLNPWSQKHAPPK